MSAIPTRYCFDVAHSCKCVQDVYRELRLTAAAELVMLTLNQRGF
jgi:hypothetical protein